MLDNFSLSQQVHKPAVRSRDGIVASQHIVASAVGAQVLAQGADAVDAAIATSMALGVVEPWMSGLAAGGCMLVWRAREKRAYVVDFGMRSPMALNPADYPLSGQGIASDLFPWAHVVDDRNVRGASAVAVPGLVAGMALVHDAFATQSWSSLLRPAAELAHQGMLTDWYSALLTGANAKTLSMDADTARYFLSEGKWPILGGWTSIEHRRLDQKTLARTLETLADEGPDSFYRGSIAQALVRDVQNKGGCLSLADLSEYRAQIVDPLIFDSTHGQIYAPGQFSGGPTLMDALDRLSQQDTPEQVGSEAYRQMAQALAQAFEKRLNEMGDHESAQAPGCTTHFSVVDRDGNMCAVTQTLLSIFGSRVTSPSTGLLLNNGIMWFDPEPGKPNSLAAGKRCLANYCPVIGRASNGIEFAIGASGGRKILGTVLQLSRFMMVHDASLEQAFARARIDVSSPHQIIADTQLSTETLEALATVLPVQRARRHIYPYAFACPAGVARQDDWNYGCTETYTPWGDAVAANT